MTSIKQGYKQSKVGIIPEDWDFGGLSKIANIEMGQSPLGDTYNTEQVGIALINGPTEFTDRYPIKKQWTSKPTKLCKKGDVLICVRGSSTGRINISNDEYCIGRGVAAICNKKQKGDIDFIEQVLNILSVKILKLTSGSTFPNIDKKTLNEFLIPLPPLQEQEKIAEILTTWDEAISLHVKLIEEKEQLKIGLMQKLLSGEVRFAGFCDEWEEVRLRKICEIKKGEQLNKDTLESNAEFPVINGGIEPSGFTDEWNTEANTITISEGGNSCGYVNFLREKFWSGGHCYSLLNLKIDRLYLYQFLKYNQSAIMKLRVGSGLPNIQKSTIEKFIIYKPSLPEQQKIAEILSLGDDELNLLKKELEVLKEQKKGLMQKLLTGEVRVKV